MNGSGSILAGASLGAALLATYLVPTMVAWLRDSPDKWPVTIVNVLLGWTLIGWVAAMVMAVWRDR